jgi:hypothetical protein
MKTVLPLIRIPVWIDKSKCGRNSGNGLSMAARSWSSSPSDRNRTRPPPSDFLRMRAAGFLSIFSLSIPTLKISEKVACHLFRLLAAQFRASASSASQATISFFLIESAGRDETFGPVFGVEETSNGSLWLGRGRDAIEIPVTEIQRFLGDPSYRVKYRVFDSFDGFPGLYAKVFQATDGKLWISASDGIAWIDPANISTNALPPPVLIRSVRANGRQACSLTNLAVPARTTDLQIGYTAFR